MPDNHYSIAETVWSLPPVNVVTHTVVHANIVERKTDSATASPKKTAVFFNERFMAVRHEEGFYEKKDLHISSCVFMFAKDSNDDVGVARSAEFQELRPGAGVKNWRFR